jgi:hypothetical protein
MVQRSANNPRGPRAPRKYEPAERAGTSRNLDDASEVWAVRDGPVVSRGRRTLAHLGKYLLLILGCFLVSLGAGWDALGAVIAFGCGMLFYASYENPDSRW